MSDYLFDQAWAHERRRLDALGRMYDPFTIEHLTRVGIAPGARCLEVGAGSGTVARWMQQQVGGEGVVVATDIDPRHLELLAGNRIDVRRHDIAADALDEKFEVIHARCVIQHIPDRPNVVAKLARALRPGGWLVLEDIVMPHPACYPALPQWEKILRGMTAGLMHAGADPFVGLRMKSMMETAGLEDIHCDPRVPMMLSATPSIEFVALSIEQVGPKLIDVGMIERRELDETLTAFRTPGYTMTAAIMIATSGRAPGKA